MEMADTKSLGRPPVPTGTEFSDLLSEYDVSLTELNKLYGIPIHTMSNWKAGIRSCPQYVLTLLRLALDMRKWS